MKTDGGYDRQLSRLEWVVLGLVSKGAPCTAYWIRRQLQESRSSYFSGSAGAVYPAVGRLEKRSLVAAETRQKGRRESRVYGLTRSGEIALREWLLPPFPAADVAFTMDPLRTRVYYLGTLEPGERKRFAEEALSQAKQREAVVRAELDGQRRSADRFDYLGGLGVLHETRGRVRWLQALCRELADKP